MNVQILLFFKFEIRIKILFLEIIKYRDYLNKRTAGINLLRMSKQYNVIMYYVVYVYFISIRINKFW